MRAQDCRQVRPRCGPFATRHSPPPKNQETPRRSLPAPIGLLGHGSGTSDRRHGRPGAGRGAELLGAGRLQIVAVGDATKITDILRKQGDLEIYDADGNLVK